MADFIKSENLEVGMVLADSILNKFGQVLANTGVKVDERLMLMLKTWGIDTVLIKSNDDDEDIKINEETRKLFENKIINKLNFKAQTKIEEKLVDFAILYFYKFKKGSVL